MYQENIMLKTSVLFCHVTSVLLLLNIFGLLSALFSYVTSFLLSNVFSAADGHALELLPGQRQ